MRGFSLVESLFLTVVLVSMIVIVTPALLPVLRQGQLRHAGERLAVLVADARLEALRSGHCVRLRTEGPRRVVAERLNSFDCLTDPRGSPRAGDGPLWVLLKEFTARLPGPLKVHHERSRTPPPTRRGSPSPSTGASELRFLPNGRLLTSSDGPWGFDIEHAQLPTENRIHLIVERGGRSCVFTGTLPSHASCP